jgi:hypothetical protein
LAQCDVSERTDIDALVKAGGESTPPLSRLFTLGRIANVELKNRIVMPSMTTRNADREGNVTENTIAYFCARADGGGGLSRWRWPRRKRPAATATSNLEFTANGTVSTMISAAATPVRFLGDFELVLPFRFEPEINRPPVSPTASQLTLRRVEAARVSRQTRFGAYGRRHVPIEWRLCCRDGASDGNALTSWCLASGIFAICFRLMPITTIVPERTCH